jgi:probable F420-dependent oxidoreductase
MPRFRVGVQLHPQGGTIEQLRDAWRAADALTLDSIWVWDHFFPLYGNPDGNHYEAYTLLAAMAAETAHARLGALVTCSAYRNPQLLADMARTIDLVSGGRFVLGIGSGWYERDFTEYGYDFGTAPSRLRDLERDLGRIMDRLGRLTPPPVGDLPILIGGGGEKVTLRLVAQYADAWNAFGPPPMYAEKSRVLDDWCRRLERNPHEVERTAALQPDEVGNWAAYLDAGAQHLIVMTPAPYDLGPVEELLTAARG